MYTVMILHKGTWNVFPEATLAGANKRTKVVEAHPDCMAVAVYGDAEYNGQTGDDCALIYLAARTIDRAWAKTFTR